YIAYHNSDVIILGAKPGLTAEYDGALHHATEDIGYLRCIPNLQILVPSDVDSTKMIAEKCLKEKGPKYIRLVRKYIENDRINQNKDWAPYQWIRRNNSRVLICTYGIMLSESIIAVNDLSTRGIDIDLINILQISPLDKTLFNIINKYRN